MVDCQSIPPLANFARGFFLQSTNLQCKFATPCDEKQCSLQPVLRNDRCFADGKHLPFNQKFSKQKHGFAQTARPFSTFLAPRGGEIGIFDVTRNKFFGKKHACSTKQLSQGKNTHPCVEKRAFAWGFCKLCTQKLPCCGVVASGVPAFLGVVWFGKTVDKTPLLIYTLGAKSKSILLFGAKICPCKCVLAHVL